MKTIAVVQARMGSTRVPGKVMRILGDKPVLAWAVDAALNAKGVDQVVLATSILEPDNVIAEYCQKVGIDCFRGSESDVLDRFFQCAIKYQADYIIRLTADCPFHDPAVISEVVALRRMTGVSYASNVDPPSYPDGLDVECFSFNALKAAHVEAVRATDRDCVTRFISRNRYRFPAANLRCPLPGLHKERWVLDTEDDWKFCEAIVARLGGARPPSYMDILSLIEKEPRLRTINSKWKRNERFYEALAEDEWPRRAFKRSSDLLSRTLKTIPFGAQTFSKSHIQFPAGHSPLYLTHGDGAYVYDVDGHDYVDLVSAILPVVLGYRDPDVDQAIHEQLDRGISLSLATDRECELSELLVRHIPCAERVKLGKSGTDVTTAAIRVARAATGRDTIALSGYHGWSDWSMAATDRNRGIPEAVRSLSVRVPFGQAELTRSILEATFPAAVIVEPNDNPGFLKWLRDYCTSRNIILIFDEIINGFRYSLGGAQKYFGVTPDLATFGKAMGNGMPISAIVGKEELMRLMEPPNNIFYSGTMFGECLSIAAAIATINKIEREGVIQHLGSVGMNISDRVETIIANYGLDGEISLYGHYSRRTLRFKDDRVRTLFMMEMAQNGVLIIASHNVSYAMGKPEIDRIRHAYDQTCYTIAQAITDDRLDDLVRGSVVAAAPLRATA